MSGRRNHTNHRVGEWHPRARLTDQQVSEMRAIRHETGASYQALASRFSCGVSTARDIVTYRTRMI